MNDRDDDANVGIDRLKFVKVKVRAELGGADMTLSEISSISGGSVIQLDNESGEPLLIYANDVLIAKGEAVSVNGKYGVRIVEIIKP